MTPIPLGILDFPTAGGTHELIETIDVASNVASVTFSNISQDFEMLELTYNLDNSSSTDIVAYQNAGNVSNSASFVTGATTAPTSDYELNNYAIIGRTHSDTGNTGIGRIIFHKYNSTSYGTGFFGVYSKPDRESGWLSGIYNDTVAMTSLQITVLAGNVNAGSRISLFGIRGAA